MKYIESIAFKDTHLDICLMENHDGSEVEMFLSAFYKSFGVRYNLDSKWFNWFYNDSPFGRCDNYLLVDQVRRDIIGAFGYGKTSYNFNGNDFPAFIGVNGFIIPEYSGKGLYTILMRQSLLHIRKGLSFGFSFPHSTNVGSIRGHEKSGWTYTLDLIFFVKRIPRINDNEIDRNIVVSEPLVSFVDFNFLDCRKGNFFNKSYPWFKWRFFDRPGKKYFVYAEKGKMGETIGFMVTSVYSSKSGIKRLQIADYEADTTDTLLKMLNRILTYGACERCETLELLSNEGNKDITTFKAFGFEPASERYTMFSYNSSIYQSLPAGVKLDFSCFDVI